LINIKRRGSAAAAASATTGRHPADDIASVSDEAQHATQNFGGQVANPDVAALIDFARSLPNKRSDGAPNFGAAAEHRPSLGDPEAALIEYLERPESESPKIALAKAEKSKAVVKATPDAEATFCRIAGRPRLPCHSGGGLQPDDHGADLPQSAQRAGTSGGLRECAHFGL
jgi:hypothetical protein